MTEEAKQRQSKTSTLDHENRRDIGSTADVSVKKRRVNEAAPTTTIMNFASGPEWWDLAIPLIDIREDQSEHAIKSSEERVVVHLSFSSLISGERSCELPPRHVEFGILVEGGYDVQQLQDFFFATTSKATQQSRKPWQVTAVLVASPELWTQAKELGIHEEIVTLSPGAAAALPFKPLPRLWQPDPLIRSVLWPILAQSLPSTQGACEIWDLGSGAGRDACFLAERIKALEPTITCCTVVGIDNHKASAKRCEPFWTNRKVEELTQSLNLNLNKVDLVEQHLSSSSTPVLCFYAVRFWNRKLVTFLAQDTGSRQKPGTLFATSHFCKPYPGASWDFDHPKVSRVLERDELAKLFGNDRWEILNDSLVPDGDHGRNLIQFVARRR